MNAKKCKVIRLSIRETTDASLRQTKYVGQSKGDKFGIGRDRRLSISPCRLNHCGRLAYKQAKKAAA